MDLLRRHCSALVDHYLYAQVAVLLGLGVPALVARFFDEHFALVLGGLALVAMAVNTVIARRRWRRITSAWACDEATRHHATAYRDLEVADGNPSPTAKPTWDALSLRNTDHHVRA